MPWLQLIARAYAGGMVIVIAASAALGWWVRRASDEAARVNALTGNERGLQILGLIGVPPARDRRRTGA